MNVDLNIGESIDGLLEVAACYLPEIPHGVEVFFALVLCHELWKQV